MAFNFREYSREDAELDVTAFMNLMIVLVPVMLLSLTFTQITVHEISLPSLTPSSESAQEKPSQLEVMLTAEEGIKVFYPGNVLIQTIPMKMVEEQKTYDFAYLSLVLQKVKQQLADKRDVLILSEPGVDYQTLVSTMDAVKSHKTVVAASLVEIELFPEISLAETSIK
ncbi:ExbD/TolR family protein [Aliikangiella coralliicola]|uniref:Biopolymer transporter ExbD n=1 Tax=Aliikangiella coralliicola TaxID=2592383 RepID=A0A545U018_9GAMM|nr:biopolymer transporter ExbD [Aliikangiella coralliicola]TQV82809.1 biopolymer transporter ExbD [Aliikangiella coralliicola]